MREDLKPIPEWYKKNQLEINPINWKFNEWLMMDISFTERLEKIADKVEKENGHIVFVFDEPEDFSKFFKKIKEDELYQFFPDNYVLLKWNVENEVRSEIVPKIKAEDFIETAPYYMFAQMYTKSDFENEENLYSVDKEAE